MQTTDRERFAESINYQQNLLDKYFAEYVGKAANDNAIEAQSQAA